MSNIPSIIEQGLEPARIKVNGFYTYLCFPQGGDLTKCMIKRIYAPDENTTEIDFPFGFSLFKYNWDERETYDYSPRKD